MYNYKVSTICHGLVGFGCEGLFCAVATNVKPSGFGNLAKLKVDLVFPKLCFSIHRHDCSNYACSNQWLKQNLRTL